MDYFEDVLLPEIYNYCMKKSDAIECFVKRVSLLPLSEEGKKAIIRNFVDKKVGRRTFLAQLLARYIYLCEENQDCEVPSLLPEDLVIQLFSLIRSRSVHFP